MYESADKMVSHPPHYQSETGLEVIDVIEAFTFDLKGIEATDTGNIIKYICRWKQKNGLQDLEKARWYLEHLIDHVKRLKEDEGAIQLVNTDHGIDILMSSICSCPRCTEDWTLYDCERMCTKYASCENVPVALDILKEEEND